MRLIPAAFRLEEQQYAPFVAGAVFFGLVVGFPLGLTLAYASAQESTLGGRWAALAQVHGHLQLMGWFGLFVMGMGYRLVPRFTGVKVRPAFLPPLTFVLVAAGLALRAVAQPFADGDGWAALFVLSAVMEAAGDLLFSATVLRCLALGRRDEFLYSPYFAAGAAWLAAASILNLVFVTGAALDGERTIDATRSLALGFVLLYGFASMFIFAVSLRAFPIFFNRRPAPRQAALGVWLLANGAIAAYTAAVLWRSYDLSADSRLLQTAGFLGTALALIAMVGILRVFEGQPLRLRVSARRSMRFVRSAFAWLLLAAALQVFSAVRALLDARLPAYYEVDAVRHFLALGFVSMMIIGMALLVMPRLAMRRAQARPARIVAPLLLALFYGAAAARGAGSLLANEAHLNSGFWTMTVGGTLGIIAMLSFAAYLVWTPRESEIPVSLREPASE